MSIQQNSRNEALLKGEALVKSVIEKLIEKDCTNCLPTLMEAQKIFQQEKSFKDISICLSLTGLVEYLLDKNKYLKALTYVNDGTYLADSTNDISAKLINELALSTIDCIEGDITTAILHCEKAEKFCKYEDKYGLSKSLREHRAFLEERNLAGKRDPLIALLRIGQTVAAETNIDVLLKVIAEETKTAIEADRCSVFLYDKVKDELWSKVALGMDSQEIRFPANKGLAGHVVQTGEAINIKDAYQDERFNKEIDLQTGYKTKTILCMPIKNLKQEIIGAFQVLNKISGEFTEEDEDLLVAIGSSAGIALENAQLFKKQQEMFFEQKLVFDSFIDTLATSIDARDSITAGHSSRVRMYSGLITRKLQLDTKLIEVIEKAATLHDIGKIGIRDSVLQKEGKLTEEEYKHIQEHVSITYKILDKIHRSEDFQLVKEIACSHHEKYDGSGYYRHLVGEEIHIGGRILAVADVFDALTSKRHYRDKMPITNVINILLKDSGTHFDPKIVDCFLNISTEKIVNVFLTENHLSLEEEHKKVLENYSMMDLYKITTDKESEDLTKEEENFIDLFQFYYMAKSHYDVEHIENVNV